MKRVLKWTAALMILSAGSLWAGVGNGSTIVGIDAVGYGGGNESHNQRFEYSNYYLVGFKGEYVPWANKKMALGVQPYIGFGIGSVAVNPTIMGNILLHVMRRGTFDPYVRVGAGMSRISEGQELLDADGERRNYTVSDGFFQMNTGVGANIWINKKMAITLDLNVGYIGRTMYWAGFGFQYKLRSLRK